MVKNKDIIFEEISLLDLNPATYNPRIISNDEFNKLSRSIDEFGLVDPILVNLQTMTIIGGHQRFDVLLDEYHNNGRYKKLLLLKRGDIGWVFTDDDLEIKSIEHEKALNIALNKISGEWDYQKLEELLTDLSSMDFELSLTGFDNLDLGNLGAELDDIDLGEETSEEVTPPKVEDLTPKLVVMFDEEEDKETLYYELVERGFKCQY